MDIHLLASFTFFRDGGEDLQEDVDEVGDEIAVSPNLLSGLLVRLFLLLLQSSPVALQLWHCSKLLLKATLSITIVEG